MYKNCIAFFGLTLIAVASYAGIVFEFKHFYEFLLVGILCILSAIHSLSNLTMKQHIRLYAYFFAAGLIVDLLLGLYITKLWYYNYSFFYEYVLLYTIVYPLGGYVMVWSFLSLKKRIPLISVNRSVSSKVRLFIIVGSIITTALVYQSKAYFASGQWAFLFAGVITVCMILFCSALWFKNIKNTYFGYLLLNPKKMILITVLVVYGNMFLHELPNVVATQWVYTVTTHTILDNLLLGIPLGLWVLWPSLLIGPMVIYDHVLTKNNLRSAGF